MKKKVGKLPIIILCLMMLAAVFAVACMNVSAGTTCGFNNTGTNTYEETIVQNS